MRHTTGNQVISCLSSEDNTLNIIQFLQVLYLVFYIGNTWPPPFLMNKGSEFEARYPSSLATATNTSGLVRTVGQRLRTPLNIFTYTHKQTNIHTYTHT